MELQEQIMQLQPEPDRDGIHLHPIYKDGFWHARHAAAKLAAQHVPASGHWTDGPEAYVITKAKNVMLGAMTYPYTPAASDDGDEARLEAACGLNVLWGDTCVTVVHNLTDIGRTEFFADHGGDKQKARRRAGVRAAAEIGGE